MSADALSPSPRPPRSQRPERPERPQRSPRRWPWVLALLAVVAGAIAVAILPILIMRPFSPQSAAGIAGAWTLLRLGPWATLLALAAAAAIAARLWSATRWPGRLALAAALLPLAGAAWMARQNVFEKMFPPLPHPGYVTPAAAAAFVAPAEMVLAVEVGGEAVAYPVRQIAYHHVVEDVVGGTPLAVTY